MCAKIEEKSSPRRNRGAQTAYVAIYMAESDRAALEELAKENERTVSGEARLAIRRHLKASEATT